MMLTQMLLNCYYSIIGLILTFKPSYSVHKRILSRCVSQSKKVASDDKRLNNILGLHWFHFTLLCVWFGRSYQPFNQNFAKSSSEFEIAHFSNVTLKLILTVTCTIEELRMLSFDLQSIAILILLYCFPIQEAAHFGRESSPKSDSLSAGSL